ncbi:endoglucanase A-like [Littorina saxatilis]|uniref:Endoglucanase n=1 Tax=Littorina saxatilis TaxID=31220 RepID=A0AAN9G3J3_9CAEN
MLVGLALLAALAGAAVGLQLHAVNHWSGGFQVEAKIPICKEVDGWKVHLVFSVDVDTLECWVGKVAKQTSREFIVTNQEYNGVQHNGDTLAFTFLGHGTGDVDPDIEATVEGMGDCAGGTPGQTLPPGQTRPPGTHAPVTAPPNTGGGTSNKDYADALKKSILFYAAQRSGKLPANNPIKWRGDSALNDCVVGGWYDAGDHVKFALPFGSTTLVLLWGMHIFKDGYAKAGQLDEAYDMVKWATDYMLNAWNPRTKELVAQIGDGNDDHHFWGRAEDMTMARPCMKLGPGKPGSDVAGEWAAALAAGYLVFKEKGDTAYATKLLTAAESLYAWAKANPGTYTSSIQGAGQFYSSSGYKDEMCEGGVWLYRATNNQEYLSAAKTYHENAWAWALSWDDKKVACQLLLFEETQDAAYKQEVVGYMDGWLPSGQVSYTPCGLAWRDKWGANRYAGNSAFLALAAAEAGISTAKYRAWAIEQINFLLGDNNHDGGCFSYAIGVGTKYPKSPHHRSASCPDRPAPCSEANLHASGPSPQLLVGALVGGPDQSGNYKDDREDYVMNEVAIDYNSGYHSSLAGIVHLKATNNFPPTHNKCPCKA